METKEKRHAPSRRPREQLNPVATDLLEANQLILQELQPINHGKVKETATLTNNVGVGEGTIIHGRTTIRGPVVIGEHCEIGPNTYIPSPMRTFSGAPMSGQHPLVPQAIKRFLTHTLKLPLRQPPIHIPIRLTPTQHEVHDPSHLMSHRHNGAPSTPPPRHPLIDPGTWDQTAQRPEHTQPTPTGASYYPDPRLHPSGSSHPTGALKAPAPSTTRTPSRRGTCRRRRSRSI